MDKTVARSRLHRLLHLPLHGVLPSEDGCYLYSGVLIDHGGVTVLWILGASWTAGN